MIKIILAGAAGRMGQAILKVLPNFKDLSISHLVEAGGHPQIGKGVYKNIKLESDISKLISDCDVLADFTDAESSIINLTIASADKKAVVMGTTGHNSDQRAHIVSAGRNVPIVYSPNMSVGVNAMWKLIEEASSILGRDYQIDIVETHHVHKKDAPSGTAEKMLEIVAKFGGYNLNKDVFFHFEGEGHSPLNPLPSREGKKVTLKSVREGDVVGDHTIIFTSPYERLEITHRAFSREVFAVGALKAVEWIVEKPAGLYGMADVLGIK